MGFSLILRTRSSSRFSARERGGRPANLSARNEALCLSTRWAVSGYAIYEAGSFQFLIVALEVKIWRCIEVAWVAARQFFYLDGAFHYAFYCFRVAAAKEGRLSCCGRSLSCHWRPCWTSVLLIFLGLLLTRFESLFRRLLRFLRRSGNSTSTHDSSSSSSQTPA